MKDVSLGTVEEVTERLAAVGYLTDAPIATIVHLADALGKPLLTEGSAGVGKTELAKSVAAALGIPLVRLQCYEGVDEAKVLYEWNYKKQLLRIQADQGSAWDELSEDIFSEPFLLERPVLRAIRAQEPVVLLIDEVDKLDFEAEALLLEVLSDWQVTIPEMGTIAAARSRSSSLRRTTSGSCPKPSSAGACTCFSTIRPPSARSRSCWRASPTSRRRWRNSSCAWSRRYASSSSRRLPP
jgi:hypothetical protein